MLRTKRRTALVCAALMVATLMWLPQPASSGTFPGFNGRIAFVGDADGDEEIYTIFPNGTGLTQLTVDTISDSSPAWNVDGTLIAWEANGNIQTMPWDGSYQQLATTMGNCWSPTWSASGRIAFQHAGNIWSVLPDSTGLRQLTSSGKDSNPEWSPSSTVIAFSRGTSDKIFIMNANGTNVRRVAGAESTPAYVNS